MGSRSVEPVHGARQLKGPRTGKKRSRGRARRKGPSRVKAPGGKLRIGDAWNAITIIALSQSNPLKAIAEFVENSIDARAHGITIIRGKERAQSYLRVVDDGEGIPLNQEGLPDFRYVATHICDSIKRRLKREGIEGIQGEFGIGLLSFWTVGERLTLASAGADGRVYQMEMRKNEQGYTVSPKRTLFAHSGTELTVAPLLPGVRQLSGEKMQSYLASELRDRIRRSGVQVTIRDRQARKELEVQPRQYSGRLLHEISALQTGQGELYLELYLNAQSPENHVSLFRAGTRVLPSLTELEPFRREPWNSGHLQGMIDAPFLQLTPGTRSGVVQDDRFETLCRALATVEPKLQALVEQARQAEEEQASRNILRSVQRALREAFLTLPAEEYSWFDLRSRGKQPSRAPGQGAFFEEEEQQAQGPVPEEGAAMEGIAAPRETAAAQEAAAAQEREFYEYPGTLYKALVSPASCTLRVNTERSFRCIPRDRHGRVVEENVIISWRIEEGLGELSSPSGEIVTYTAPPEPGLVILEATASQGEAICQAQAIITVTETLIEQEEREGEEHAKGLPGYTFLRAPGELWRSRYDLKNNLIVINNGHKDYIFAAQKRARKLKYICRLFAKELVLHNFPGFESGELIERMIELALYTEEHLR
jgi:hypothetical protein